METKLIGVLAALALSVVVIGTTALTTVFAQVPTGCTGEPHDADAPTANPHDPSNTPSGTEGGNPHDIGSTGQHFHEHNDDPGSIGCPGAQ
jgi:hypothetical protein